MRKYGTASDQLFASKLWLEKLLNDCLDPQDPHMAKQLIKEMESKSSLISSFKDSFSLRIACQLKDSNKIEELRNTLFSKIRDRKANVLECLDYVSLLAELPFIEFETEYANKADSLSSSLHLVNSKKKLSFFRPVFLQDKGELSIKQKGLDTKGKFLLYVASGLSVSDEFTKKVLLERALLYLDSFKYIEVGVRTWLASSYSSKSWPINLESPFIKNSGKMAYALPQNNYIFKLYGYVTWALSKIAYKRNDIREYAYYLMASVSTRHDQALDKMNKIVRGDKFLEKLFQAYVNSHSSDDKETLDKANEKWLKAWPQITDKIINYSK